MGLSRHVISFLIDRHNSGVDFSSACTLGRQELNTTPDELGEILRGSPISDSSDDILKAFNDPTPYGDALFTALGCKELRSLDHSNFEGATDIHNLNEPLPPDDSRRFSVLFDGGTLEHVFNFPVAIANCMRLVAVGGHFLGLSFANNLSGHGFYQFSPELMFRIFSEENGFADTEVFIVEQTGDGSRYRTNDPKIVGHRIQITNTRPTFLLVCSKRVREVTPFESWPQQSDYQTRWDDHAAGGEGKAADHFKRPKKLLGSKLLKKALPKSLTKQLITIRRRRLEKVHLAKPYDPRLFEHEK